ncbi:MAG TPA: acyl-ACP--UDP-N-acetylglucosamine O-acyltransferase [Opitutaceae bacterium]|nr:acyl-ACP--UDP-N-acetylglucosamine O-acyltransferase [Opitutaceae bacterium]
MSIHPTAIVEDGAQLGADCVVHAHAVVTRYARLGDGVIVHPGAVVGGDPQALKFDPATSSHVRVGARTVLREQVTVNRSTVAGGETMVGADCFLMAGAHVAHDCVVGDHVVLANNVLLAGHVSLGSFTFVGGGAAFHQFTRVGESAMVGGLARITLDIPPFVMAAERDEIVGLNLVGLKRRGFSREVMAELKECFREVYFDGGNVRHRAQAMLARGVQSPEVRRFLEFFAGGRRGIARARGAWSTESEGENAAP